jgi:hypothetical protein
MIVGVVSTVLVGIAFAVVTISGKIQDTAKWVFLSFRSFAPLTSYHTRVSSP